MIVGRVVVRDRDLCCVGLIVWAQGTRRCLGVKIPIFQPLGYQTASVSAAFGGLGRFDRPEHRRWGWILRYCTGEIIRVLRVPVPLWSGRFADPGRSFVEYGGSASLVVAGSPIRPWRWVGRPTGWGRASVDCSGPSIDLSFLLVM